MASSRHQQFTPNLLRQGLLWTWLVSIGACGGSDIIDPPPPQAQDLYPAWSPDGQLIAFEHEDSNGNFGIYTASVSGGPRTLVVDRGADADWSPDGRTLAFVLGLQVHRVELESRVVTALTSEGLNLSPSWSPDGRTLAFTSNGANNQNPPDLWLMNPDGTNGRRVPLSGPPHAELFDLDWAPTGDRLVSSLSGRLSISDTLGRETFVTAPTLPAYSPAWRPQGDWIAYAKTPLGEFGDLWLIRPDGTGDHLLIRDANFPTWSPDGRRVAFSHLRSGQVAIWAIDIDGSNLQQLTEPSE